MFILITINISTNIKNIENIYLYLNIIQNIKSFFPLKTSKQGKKQYIFVDRKLYALTILII